jgi:hypothetical protein
MNSLAGSIPPSKACEELGTTVMSGYPAFIPSSENSSNDCHCRFLIETSLSHRVNPDVHLSTRRIFPTLKKEAEVVSETFVSMHQVIGSRIPEDSGISISRRKKEGRPIFQTFRSYLKGNTTSPLQSPTG